jgi:hypothetical protein
MRPRGVKQRKNQCRKARRHISKDEGNPRLWRRVDRGIRYGSSQAMELEETDLDIQG